MVDQRGGATPAKKEKKEKKEKKDKDDKKEKKEKKSKRDSVDFDAQAKPVTYLGGVSPTVIGGGVASKDASPRDDTEEDFPEAEAIEEATSPEPEEAEPDVEGEFHSVQWAGDLTWPTLVVGARLLLQRRSRFLGAEFEASWASEYGYSLAFPLFGLEDAKALLHALQPGALHAIGRQGGSLLNSALQASGEKAFMTETDTWQNLAESGRAGTVCAWAQAKVEDELKLVRRSLGERRRAQKDAEAQVEKIREEYKALQAANKGKSQLVKATKQDMDKQEQKAAKFKGEAEEFEATERDLLAKLRRISERPAAPAKSPTVPPPRSPDGAGFGEVKGAEADRSPQQEPQGVAPAAVAEDDFM